MNRVQSANSMIKYVVRFTSKQRVHLPKSRSTFLQRLMNRAGPKKKLASQSRTNIVLQMFVQKNIDIETNCSLNVFLVDFGSLWSFTRHMMKMR